MKSFGIRSFSGLYFATFRLNMERFRYLSVFNVQSKCWKIRTKKCPNIDTFHAVSVSTKSSNDYYVQRYFYNYIENKNNKNFFAELKQYPRKIPKISRQQVSRTKFTAWSSCRLLVYIFIKGGLRHDFIFSKNLIVNPFHETGLFFNTVWLSNIFRGNRKKQDMKWV